MAGCRSDPRHRRYIENIEPAPDTRNADATPEQRPDIDHGLEPPATAIVAQQNQRATLVREPTGFDMFDPQRHRAILAGCRQASKRRRTVLPRPVQPQSRSTVLLTSNYEIDGPLRPRPIAQLMPSPRIRPDTGLPICGSSTGRHGTSVNSRDFSISA